MLFEQRINVFKKFQTLWANPEMLDAREENQAKFIIGRNNEVNYL